MVERVGRGLHFFATLMVAVVRGPMTARVDGHADLGGWETVETELFAPESGTIAVAYDNATE